MDVSGNFIRKKMKWIFLLFFIGFLVAKDNLAEQTSNILVLKKSVINLPERSNNWMGVQSKDDWLGLSEKQIHERQLKFDTPENGIRAGAISLMTRALRKNNKPELTISQIFFESDGWAEDQQSYMMDAISKGFKDTDVIDVMDREQMKKLINFISNHEMGAKNYEAITNKDEVINKGLDMAYDHILSNEYSLRDLING